MFKAILVDDENPALMQLERLLQADGRIQIEGRYLTAAEGLNKLGETKIDVVFLDINMPGMSGLQWAERFLELDPNVKIVYVTAHSDYALDAFEQYALDYVLKPVMPNRLEKTIDRLLAWTNAVKMSGGTPSQNQPVYRVQLFKRLELSDERGIGGRLKWRTGKAQELFAFLLYHKGEWLTKDFIIETVLKDQFTEKTAAMLHTSIYHIRKLLKEWGADAEIEYSLDSYRLNCCSLKTDVERYEQMIKQLQDLDGEAYMQAANEAVSLYKGDYLEDHGFEWAEPYRARLRTRHSRLMIQLAEAELAAGRNEEALAKLSALQDKEPYHEEALRLRMNALGQIRNLPAIRELYGRFTLLLESELEIEPEEETKRCYASWIRD